MDVLDKKIKEVFSKHLNDLTDSAADLKLKGTQNTLKLTLILYLLDNIKTVGYEDEKRAELKEESTVEDILFTTDLSRMLLLISFFEHDNEKVKCLIKDIIAKLTSLTEEGNRIHEEYTRNKKLENVKRKFFAEYDDYYRFMNSPKYRYDLTQQGTGRNAKSHSKSHTKEGRFKH